MTARDLDATHAAAVAAERHADLRTRFAVAIATEALHARFGTTLDDAVPLYDAPAVFPGAARLVYDLADALAREDARRREADGVR